jgi:hypothetical protein
MPGRSSRRKGADFEREMVHRFAEVFGSDRVHRGMQFRDGSECADVVAPAFHIECKRGLRTNPRAALAQATEDSIGKGLWPIAVCKDDKEQPFVTLHLDDFLDLLREWWGTRSR